MAHNQGVSKYNPVSSNWITIYSGMTNAMAYLNSVLIIGTNNGGVYYSTDGGQQWTQSNLGFETSTVNPNTDKNVRVMAAHGNTVYAVTFEGEVFKRDVNNLMSGSTSLMSKFDENRIKIYPNPTNTGILNIDGVTGNISYNFYDNLGRIVESGTTSSGKINLSTVYKGVYSLELTSQGYIQRKSVIIQ
jgi:hypothetical protein